MSITNRQEWLKAIAEIAREYSEYIFWSKIYYPKDKLGRAIFLLDCLKNSLYFTMDFYTLNYYKENGIAPGPQFAFIYDFEIKEDLVNKARAVRLSFRHGVLDDCWGEISWIDETGQRQDGNLESFYEKNKGYINHKTFYSNDLFDYLLALSCVKRSQRGLPEAQDIILNSLGPEAQGIARSFFKLKSLDETETDPDTLALNSLRTVIFGTSVKNYLKDICQYQDYSTIEKAEIMSTRKILDNFLESIDKIPAKLVTLYNSTSKEKIPDGQEQHYIGSWINLALLIADPIQALKIDGKMFTSMYEPRKYGILVNWLFGNRSFAKPTGAFHRRLNDFYKAKTRVKNKKRIPKEGDELSEFDDDYSYSEVETITLNKREDKLLSPEEVLNLYKQVQKYKAKKKIKDDKADLIFNYGIRRNFKVGFKLKKQYTLEDMSKNFNCSKKTAQRAVSDFEDWQHAKI